MPSKKVQRHFDVAKKRTHLPPEVAEVLRLLQQKVLASPVLNGGFDAMMIKVDQIEEGQKQLAVKVDSIHEAVYHPDEGLFARVKDVEHVKEKVAVTEQLEKDVAKLQQWHETEEKALAKEEKLSEEHEKLVKDHADKIKDLVQFKSRVCAIVKWGLVTLGGGTATLIGKLIYDLVSGHITFH